MKAASVWLLFAWTCLFGGGDLSGPPLDLGRASLIPGATALRAPSSHEDHVADDARADAEPCDDEDSGDNDEHAPSAATPASRPSRLCGHVRARASDAPVRPGCEMPFRSDDAWRERATPSRGPPTPRG